MNAGRQSGWQPADSVSMISSALVSGGTFSQWNANIQFHGTSSFERLQKEVVSSAFHDSSERANPPTCHKNTRSGILERIIDWIQGSDWETRDTLVLWLHGLAGAGKSAIAQIIAEWCYREKHLLASFFFNRADSTRNNHRSLVATIAYQICITVPALQPHILANIDKDPLIFKRSLVAQFTSLVSNPLAQLFQLDSPHVIVIDGLDECVDRAELSQLITHILQQPRLRFIFLITSRPEHDIRVTFNSNENCFGLSRLSLDNRDSADQDIINYLCDKFCQIKRDHPFRRLIPTRWPDDDVIQKLVNNSSGQFIYPATVVKFVESIRHRPDHRLDIVMRLRPVENDPPFAELDALYSEILYSVEDIDTVLHVLSFHIIYYLHICEPPTIHAIEDILALEPGTIEVFFCDLASIIPIEDSEEGDRKLNIAHASLFNFFNDPSRSREFYIDTVSESMEHCLNCIRHLLAPGNSICYDSYTQSLRFLDTNLVHLPFMAELKKLISEISFRRLAMLYGRLYARVPQAMLNTVVAHELQPTLTSREVHPTRPSIEPSMLENLHAVIKVLLNYLINAFENLTARQLYFDLRVKYDNFITDQLSSYILDDRVALHLVLLSCFKWYHIPNQILTASFQLYDFHSSSDEHLNETLCALGIQEVGHLSPVLPHTRWIANLLHNPTRSGECFVGEEMYARAALHCFSYIADHRDDRGDMSISSSAGYHHPFSTYSASHTDLPEEVKRKAWKYFFALSYIVMCLSHAGRSDPLIDHCRKNIVNRSVWALGDNSQSNKYVLRAMHTYLKRMGVDVEDDLDDGTTEPEITEEEEWTDEIEGIIVMQKFICVHFGWDLRVLLGLEPVEITHPKKSTEKQDPPKRKNNSQSYHTLLTDTDGGLSITLEKLTVWTKPKG